MLPIPRSDRRQLPSDQAATARLPYSGTEIAQSAIGPPKPQPSAGTHSFPHVTSDCMLRYFAETFPRAAMKPRGTPWSTSKKWTLCEWRRRRQPRLTAPRISATSSIAMAIGSSKGGGELPGVIARRSLWWGSVNLLGPIWSVNPHRTIERGRPAGSPGLGYSAPRCAEPNLPATQRGTA